MDVITRHRPVARCRGSIAAERSGTYQHGQAPRSDHDAVRQADPLDVAVEELAELDLDALGEPDIRAQLDRAQRAIVRLTAFRTRAAGDLERRALRVAGPGREQQALQGSRRRLANDLRLTPTQAKQAGETGRRMADHPAAQSAMTSGELPPEHARLLAETLRWLTPELREQAEPVLLEAARDQDARTFGRTCRRLHAQLDTDSAQRAQDRRNGRRSLKIADTPDGMLALHGQGSGLDAEIVATTVHAFRRPDADGQRRTSDQRAWDALVEACRVALDAGEAPTRHNVRPHVLVLVEDPTVRAGDAGSAEAGWTGPLPWPELRRILSDSEVSRVVLDGDRLPLEAGEGVRSVPAGLRKALQVRDGTCIGDGCDVPAMWCQIMHLSTPYRLKGRLSLDTAAPGCSYHHRMLDRRGWKVTWIRGRPVLHHPDHPPAASEPRPWATGRSRSPAVRHESAGRRTRNERAGPKARDVSDVPKAPGGSDVPKVRTERDRTTSWGKPPRAGTVSQDELELPRRQAEPDPPRARGPDP